MGRRATGSTGTPLFDAVTGEQIAEASSEGLDFEAMLEYGRETLAGRRSARMTFHQRARMLKALAQYLMARKDEFYRVSAATGATKWRLLDRHRRRHRHAVRLREPRPARVPRRDVLRRRRAGGAVEGRHLRRAAHLRAARGRRRPHQRVQLPRVGNAREARDDVPRRHAGIVKPATVTCYPHRGRRRARCRIGLLPAGSVPAPLRQRGRSARPSRQPGRRRVHRLRVDRA